MTFDGGFFTIELGCIHYVLPGEGGRGFLGDTKFQDEIGGLEIFN